MGTKFSTLFLFTVLVLGMAAYSGSHFNSISSDETINTPIQMAFAQSDNDSDEKDDDDELEHDEEKDDEDKKDDDDELEHDEEKDDEDDDRDDKKSKLEKQGEKQAKAQEKRAEAEEKRDEKQIKAQEKRDEKFAKAAEKLVKAQERLAEKLAELEEKLSEKAQLSEERANKILEKIAKETQKTDERVQKLIDKFQSGEYFGDLKNTDKEIKPFTLSFEGSAAEIGDQSNIETLSGELFLENQLTGSHSKKFRVTGGEIFVGETEVFDIVFGKARLTSSGQGGEKDSMIIIAQASDGVDVRTLKLSIDLSEEFDSDTESVEIDILFPRSKIASLWLLGGAGNLGLTDDTTPDDTTPEDIPHTTGLTVSTAQNSYVTGDEIMISGTVAEIFESTPVVLQIITSIDLIEIAQIDVNADGEFLHTIQATGPQWLTSETITVNAFYGGNNVAETTFEFSVE